MVGGERVAWGVPYSLQSRWGSLRVAHAAPPARARVSGAPIDHRVN